MTRRGWLCEMVQGATGEVISTVFSADSPIDGADKVAGFYSRSTELIEASHPSESRRLDWLDINRGAEHDSDADEHWLTAWVSQGAPGNENGASGRFIVRAKTFRECIDRFLAGQISRIE